jgi:hypothetical protein
LVKNKNAARELYVEVFLNGGKVRIEHYVVYVVGLAVHIECELLLPLPLDSCPVGKRSWLSCTFERQ